MAAPLAHRNGLVHASYHQFWVVDHGCAPAAPWVPTNGLAVATGQGAVIIHTGIHTGPVAVTVEVYDARPPAGALADWDDVVELSVTTPVGRLAVTSMDVPTEPMPVLTAAGPGHHRLRVHARGRDTLTDGVPEDGPTEQYLIRAWPAPPAPETIHRQTDRYGAAVRQFAGRRAPAARPDPMRRLIEDRLRRARE